jgi:uncharacterized protein YbjT (DUF2867 family)
VPTAFVAGATGYTGRAFLQEIQNSEWQARPHARSAGKIDGAVVCDPRDPVALTEAVRGCDAIVQLIGTVRANFAEGDYEAIDYGTTVALCAAAKAAGVPRILLLSSVGAGKPRGSYLTWKRKTEEVVESSGLEYTIVRPSVIGGEGRRGNQILGALLSPIPSLRGIEVHELARVFVRALERRDEVRNKILEGKSLWKLLS